MKVGRQVACRGSFKVTGYEDMVQKTNGWWQAQSNDGVEDIDGICFAFTAPDAGDNDGKRFSMWDRISAAVLRP